MRKSFLSCHSSARTPVPHLLSVLPCHRPPDLTDTARCCHTMKGMTSCPDDPQPSQGTKFKPRGQARQTCRVSEGGGERPHRLCDPALCAVNDRLASSGLRGRDKGSKTCRRAAEPPRGNSESIPPDLESLTAFSPPPPPRTSRAAKRVSPTMWCARCGRADRTGCMADNLLSSHASLFPSSLRQLPRFTAAHRAAMWHIYSTPMSIKAT